MDRIAPTPSEEFSPKDLERLRDWLPAGEGVGVVSMHDPREGAWYAVVLEFNIAGTGSTEREALQEMFDLLTVYLLSFVNDGRDYEDAIRRVPLPRRAHYLARVGMTKALNRLFRHRDGTSKWEIPLSAPHFA